MKMINEVLERRLKISKTAAIMMEVVMGLFLLFLVCGLLIAGIVFLITGHVIRFESPLAYGIGLFVGCLLSVIKIFLLDRSLNRLLDMEGGKAKALGSLQSILRHVLTLGFLLSAFIFPDYIGRVGIIIGVLSLQVASYITTHRLKKVEKV